MSQSNCCHFSMKASSRKRLSWFPWSPSTKMYFLFCAPDQNPSWMLAYNFDCQISIDHDFFKHKSSEKMFFTRESCLASPIKTTTELCSPFCRIRLFSKRSKQHAMFGQLNLEEVPNWWPMARITCIRKLHKIKFTKYIFDVWLFRTSSDTDWLWNYITKIYRTPWDVSFSTSLCW